MTNLKVEWATSSDLYEAVDQPPLYMDDVSVPVVRLEVLRKWLEERWWLLGEDGLHTCLDALLKELDQS